MKKHLYLPLFFFAITLCSQAQIKKGDVLLGGTLGFSTQKTTLDGSAGNNGKSSSVSLTPAIGKAIKDNLVVGVDLTYSGNSSTATQTGVGGSYSQKAKYYGAGVFVRRYTYLGSGFSIFAQTRLGGQYSTQKSQSAGAANPDYDIKGYSIGVGFYPGIAYAITKRVQLETGFQNLVSADYSHSKNSAAGVDPVTGNLTSSTTNSFSLQTSLTDNFGFAVGIRVLLHS